jgi:hypothetical protein
MTRVAGRHFEGQFACGSQVVTRMAALLRTATMYWFQSLLESG